MAGPARGKVTIDVEECKGCGLCVESCPPKCLELSPELSHYGVHPAHYTGTTAPDAASASIAVRSRARSRSIAGCSSQNVATQAQAGGENAAAL